MPSQLDLTLGAIELGVLISSVFYGNFVVQCYLYWQSTIKDRVWVKLLVAFVLLMETLHTIFVWIYLYFLTVTSYGHPKTLHELPWHLCGSLMIQGLVGSAVQAFFSYRTWVVSGTIWFAVPSWIAEIVRAGVSISLTVLTVQMGILDKFKEHYKWLVIFTVILSAVTDFWNTGILCYFLRAHNSNTGFLRTSQIINKLTMWAIETGLFTSIVAILLVAFLIGQENSAVWIGILIIYAKVYSNSLLVSLNARQRIRAMDEAPQTTGGAIVTIGSASTAPSGSRTLDLELSRIEAEVKGHGMSRGTGPIITTETYRDSELDHESLKRPEQW